MKNHDSYAQVAVQHTAAYVTAKGSTTISTDNHLSKLFSLSNGWALADKVSTSRNVDGSLAYGSTMSDRMTSYLTSGVHVSSETWRYADTDNVCGKTVLEGKSGVIVKDVETNTCSG